MEQYVHTDAHVRLWCYASKIQNCIHVMMKWQQTITGERRMNGAWEFLYCEVQSTMGFIKR